MTPVYYSTNTPQALSTEGHAGCLVSTVALIICCKVQDSMIVVLRILGPGFRVRVQGQGSASGFRV